MDDAEVQGRAWRITELIGDTARLSNDQRYRNYGYVTDAILQDGEIKGVVVQRDAAYGGRAYQAYPMNGYGWGGGWDPGSANYYIPFDEAQAMELDTFDYGQLGDS
ncbi:hypothetical protein [Rhodobacter sp. NSM]|uniref:hypothetical protein n=1 Tax=Rhodobacter sp. NSM TaxID=3457501 RepID=UPI003FD2E065